MSHRKSDLGIPCARKICQSSARACTHKIAIVRQSLADVAHHRVRQARLAEFREVLNDETLARVSTAKPRHGRPWRGSALGTRRKHPSEPRHSDEKARSHNHHSGDEYSQARKQQRVAQEYMHTPASPYLPCAGLIMASQVIALGLIPDTGTITNYFRSGAHALMPGQRRRSVRDFAAGSDVMSLCPLL